LIGLADAFDAMTSTRPYRGALSPDAALEELVRCAGTQFDPALTDACVDIWSTRALLAV
jgi:HD-GYP domain-containing protein (c-di-GMP phosphodiesterase class II)